MLEYILLSLAVTVAAEILTAVLMGIRSFYDLRLVCLVNLMTNPLVSAVYLIAGIFVGQKLVYLLLAAEILVWISEAWVYKSCMEEKCSPMILSAAANLMSVLAGYLIGKCF